MDFISQLFTELNHTDSVTVLVFLLGAFLIGWLFGRMSLSRKLKKVGTALKAKEGEMSTLSIEHGALRQQFELSEEKLTNFENENEQLRKSLSSIENDKNELNKELYFSKQRQQELDDLNAQYLNQIGLLEGELDLLKTGPEYDEKRSGDEFPSNQFAEQAFDRPPDRWEKTEDRMARIEMHLEKLERENNNLKQDLNNLKSTGFGHSNQVDESQLKYLQQKIEELENENTSLKQELYPETFEVDLFSDDEEIPIEVVFDDSDVDATVDPEMSFEDEDLDLLSPEERSLRARRQLERFMGTKIPKAGPASKDDLKAIDGIGPFIEQKLNAVGIFTFDQISEFDDELINLLTEAIQFFPGRIKRDGWVNQAGSLKKGKNDK